MKWLIVGGTGTLGQELTRQLLSSDHAVRVFSRCELKQKQMQAHYPDAQYILGDIRDYDALGEAMAGADAVIHCAALKHVDVLEHNPEEAIKTNVIGSMNVARAARLCDVKYCALSSTDKAVDPINAYGMSKGLAEKVFLDANAKQDSTLFTVFRWGNVIGSRGSVIPSFVRTLIKENKLYYTDPNMTRFWINISEAARFMIDNITESKKTPHIPPMRAATVQCVGDAVANILKLHNPEIVITGKRPGEKDHEDLTSKYIIPDYEPWLNSYNAKRFTPDDMVDLLRPAVKQIEATL